ncbi:large ribosomal subunit protein mL49 [Brachyhypopomus gauderio]|uniref:large ribosomal subunit protein mL49 n=1 Tax=Brachyhypopomus gauderio TaxID=698409 RepID=UPI004041733B
MAASTRNMLTGIRSVWVSHRVVNVSRRISTIGTCLRAENSTAGERPAIVESSEEYRFVERLIPPTRVPTPSKHDHAAPSGWIPPPETPPSLPYMIRRSRMHNVPVYSDIKHGNQMITLLRKVEGDIWALDKDVKEHLQKLTGKEPPTQVNEITGTIRIKGQFDKELKEWLLKQGF